MADSRSDQTPNEKLMAAVHKGDYEVIRGLIKDCKDISDIKDWQTSILAAAVGSYSKSEDTLCQIEKIFDLLIEAGVDLHKNKNGIDALRAAVLWCYWHPRNPVFKQQRINIINKLLDAKVDVNCVLSPHSKETPLHYAVMTGDEEICQLLIKRGASLSSTSAMMYSDTPISKAFNLDRLKLANFLLEIAIAQAKENKCDLTAVLGNSVLNVIQTRERLPLLKKLLELKANVNAQDTIKRTALHHIAIHIGTDTDYWEWGYVEDLVGILSAAGINAAINDETGRMAWQYSLERGLDLSNQRVRLFCKLAHRSQLAHSLNKLFPPLIKIIDEYEDFKSEDMPLEDKESHVPKQVRI